MIGDKAKRSYEELIKLKEKEINDYYLHNKKIVGRFLELKKEYESLKDNRLEILLSQSDILIKQYKKKK